MVLFYFENFQQKNINLVVFLYHMIHMILGSFESL